MKYGYFDDERREYVITNPKTPTKWINYLGTLAFGGIVDHTGGALICKQDPALNRITKYIPQLPGSDFKGMTLYLRFRQGDGYKVFSPYFVPTLDPYDLYECHVGLGYTRIVSEFYGIRADVTVFIPIGAELEFSDVGLEDFQQTQIMLKEFAADGHQFGCGQERNLSTSDDLGSGFASEAVVLSPESLNELLWLHLDQ